MSPTQRSLKKLRDEGFMCEVVEKWNPYVKQRKDFLGFADIIAIEENDCLAVQTTSGGNVSARLAKIKEAPGAKRWLESPSRRIEIHGWAKRGERGKRKTWQCRVLHVQQSDLNG